MFFSLIQENTSQREFVFCHILCNAWYNTESKHLSKINNQETGLNSVSFWSAFPHIQSKWWEMWTRKKFQVWALFTQFLIGFQQPLLGLLKFLTSRNGKRINNKNWKKRLDIIYISPLFQSSLLQFSNPIFKNMFCTHYDLLHIEHPK